MWAKEYAQTIRTVLKARGWNSRAVSVRMDNSGSIRVEVLSPAVPLAEVKAIAGSFEKVRRDGYGEMLEGGNLFVTVNQSEECRAALALPLIPATQDALDRLAQLDPTGGQGVSIEGAPGFYLFLAGTPGGGLLKISAPDDSWMPYYYGIEQTDSIAAAVAEAMREPYAAPEYTREVAA